MIIPPLLIYCRELSAAVLHEVMLLLSRRGAKNASIPVSNFCVLGIMRFSYFGQKRKNARKC